MPTRTRSAHFRAPAPDGQVHFEDEAYPIYAGVVECPLEIGEGAEWPRATDADVAKYDAAKKKASK